MDERVSRVLRSLAIDETAPLGNPSVSLRDADAPPPSPASKLPQLAIGGAGSDADLVVSKTIGEGGMGVVLLARQRSLRRDVAVKRVKEHAAAAAGDAEATLLREGLISGSLEHPNIVPVHALGRDDGGEPLLVMKRVEGRAWSEVLREARESGRPRGGVLREQLQVLVQVCNALDFAHSRGLVHRDVKPENVMLGSFGEVYLLDWGVACEVPGDDAPRGNVPIVGTPSYMAPEMLSGQRTDVTRAVDLYLLGATLCEVLSGRPPHVGPTFQAVLASVLDGRLPELDDDVPAELAQICLRALAREPARRYPDVASFRQTVADYLAHSSSVELTADTERRLESLLDELGPAASAERDRDIYPLFSQCRFGFRLALDGWAENRRAREGLSRCLEAMIEHELARENPGAAATLLAELPEPSAELVARVERMQARAAASARRLEQLDRDSDFRVGGRARGAIMVASGVGAAIGGLVVDHLVASGKLVVTNLLALSSLAVLEVAMIITIALARRTLLRNAANRRFVVVGLLAPPAYAVVHVFAMLLGLKLEVALVLDMLVGAVGSFVTGILHARMFLLLGAELLAFALLMALFPALTFKLFTAAALLTSVPTAWWWRRQELGGESGGNGEAHRGD